jgi:methionine sulfoxide reductase heme-binding subunit
MPDIDSVAPPSPTRIGVRFAGWAGRAAPRHLLTIGIAAGLVYAFGAVHGHWSDMHRWNKATADASLLLLTFTMAAGPAARLWPALRRLLSFRREFGVYSVLLALIHTVIILDGWVEWDLLRLAGFALHPDLGRYVMIEHGFGLANLIGIVALGYGFMLMITSNDRTARFLTGPVWKFVQTGAYVLWALVVVHTAYFLFMHFLHFHRPLPDPNPLRWAFVGLIVLVLALRLAASFQSWQHRRKASGEPGGRAETSARSRADGAMRLKALAPLSRRTRGTTRLGTL